LKQVSLATPSSAFSVAPLNWAGVEATELIELGREQFLFAVQETPLFAIELMASLERRLRGLED
jgi:hypothetical protein